ncbi:MAG: NCS2 family permease [Lentisphaerae bacterium]|nr:NCS2 family permease [Lentisphaerota bacterium]
MFERLFRLKENGVTIRVEILAGVTTFLTMAYIIFLQPLVLSTDFAGQPTGLDAGAVLLATCVVSAFATIFMGLYARYPIALAPGMGENFFFVGTIMALSAAGFVNAWQTALGVIFLSGIIFFVLSILRVREVIINAISPSMRNGIAIGIGLFIAFIGLKNGGVIIAKPGTFVGLNSNLITVDVVVFFVGLIVAGGLQSRHVRGSILWGIGAAAAVALACGKIRYNGIFGLPVIENPTVFKMDILSALSLTCAPFIVVFVFMDLFDTVGTLVGVAEQAGFMKDNKLPRASQALLVDATATVAGACMGTSTVTSYIESAAGVAYGGRTGLTSLVVGILFLAALLVSPLVGMVGNYPPVTACALVVVGALMARNVQRIDWDDYSESIPAFLTAVSIPLTFSIADGLAVGFISYPMIKLVAGKGKHVSWLMYILAGVLIAYFVLVRTKVT